MKTKTKPSKGLYIHIPFCDSICPYCSFFHVLKEYGKVNEFIDKIILDLSKYSNEEFSSIYIGGGTPSSLTPFELDKLLSEVKRFKAEISIEANPNSLDEKRIKVLHKNGVTRLSLGVQTFNKELQTKLNRFCTYESIKEIISMLNKYNIYDINLDLMYGINGETTSMLLEDLKLFVSLPITHISTYCLQIEPHTKLFIEGEEELNQDDAADQYDLICKFLKEKGFIHYEVSNFALPNKESKHNLLYWHNQEYVGLGPSSSGYEGNIRYQNGTSIYAYLNNDLKRKEEIITLKEKEEYYIILGLRLKEGINLKEYKDLFNKDFLLEYKSVLDKLQKFNKITISENRVYVEEKDFFTLNQILLEFIKDE